jgi:hypothetical protein
MRHRPMIAAPRAEARSHANRSEARPAMIDDAGSGVESVLPRAVPPCLNAASTRIPAVMLVISAPA